MLHGRRVAVCLFVSSVLALGFLIIAITTPGWIVISQSITEDYVGKYRGFTPSTGPTSWTIIEYVWFNPFYELGRECTTTKNTNGESNTKCKTAQVSFSVLRGRCISISSLPYGVRYAI